MSSKLVPANPSEVMVIRNVTPNIVTFSVPFMRFGKFPIGGRGTLVKLSSGSLAVFSPVALTPEARAKVQEMGGDLRYIVALDAEHHIFLSTWARAFPDAKLIGPAGLPEKRARMADDDDMIGREPFAVVFPSRTSKVEIDPEDFDRDFAYEFVDAHPNKELVFFYRPDRVLIEADLMFNLPANEQYSRAPGGSPTNMGMLARIFSSFQTTEGDAKGMKRFLWYVISRGDRKGFNESIQRINSWDFDTIIPCHGDTIQGNAKAVFEKVFAWHLQGHK